MVRGVSWDHMTTQIYLNQGLLWWSSCRILHFPCREYRGHMCFIPAGELRTCMLHGEAKIKKQTKNRRFASESKTKDRKWFQDILRY